MPKNELFLKTKCKNCQSFGDSTPRTQLAADATSTMILPPTTIFPNLHNFGSHKKSILISKNLVDFSASLMVIVPLHLSWSSDGIACNDANDKYYTGCATLRVE